MADDNQVTPDMLPDIQPESPETPSQPVSEDVKPPVPDSPGSKEDAPAETEPKVPDGYVPAFRYKEVKQKLKDTEEKLKDLEASEAPEEEVETEENPLAEKVSKLERELYLNRFPELNDKRDELEAFLEEKSTMELKDAITLFRAEHGLMTTPERKGLEKVVAGPKTAPSPKWTLEQIDELRQNDEKRWNRLMTEGVFDEALKNW